MLKKACTFGFLGAATIILLSIAMSFTLSAIDRGWSPIEPLANESSDINCTDCSNDLIQKEITVTVMLVTLLLLPTKL